MIGQFGENKDLIISPIMYIMEYFNCRECDKEFESYSKLDGSSKLLGKYVKYLGYCSLFLLILIA